MENEKSLTDQDSKERAVFVCKPVVALARLLKVDEEAATKKYYAGKEIPAFISMAQAAEKYESEAFSDWNNTREALKTQLFLLSIENIILVEAVMLLGRGDFESFNKAYTFLQNEYPHPAEKDKTAAIEYIMSKAPLYEYLTNGLSKI